MHTFYYREGRMKVVARRVYLKEGEVLEIRSNKKAVLRVAIGRNETEDTSLMIDLCDRNAGYDWSQSATNYIKALVDKDWEM